MQTIQWTNQNSKQINAAGAKRGKTRAGKLPLVLVLLLIGWLSGALSFSQSKEKKNNHEITFDAQIKKGRKEGRTEGRTDGRTIEWRNKWKDERTKEAFLITLTCNLSATGIYIGKFDIQRLFLYPVSLIIWKNKNTLIWIELDIQ